MTTPTAPKCFCGQIECVCAWVADHATYCRFRRSVLCRVAFECEHGYDVCPICDACNCGVAPLPASSPAEAPRPAGGPHV